MSCLVVKKKGRPHTAVYFSREDWPEFCAGSVLCEFGSGSYDDYEHENYSWNEAIGEAQASRAAAKTIVQWAMENSAVLVIGDLVSGAGTVYIVNPLPKRWVSGGFTYTTTKSEPYKNPNTRNMVIDLVVRKSPIVRK